MEAKYAHASVGNFNIDVTVYVDEWLALEEGTYASEISIRPGGAATNYAVAVASYGHVAYLVASVSKNHVVYSLLEEAKSRGVKIDYVNFVDDYPGVVLVLVDSSGERRMVRFQGANKHLKPEHARDELLSKVHVVHTASMSPGFTMEVASRAKKNMTITSYDPGPFAEQLAEHTRIARYLDTLFLNEKEYNKVKSVIDISALFEEGLRNLVIKMGSKGAVVVERGGVCHYGVAQPIRGPIDTTGAGDAFDAFFNSKYVETGKISEALLYGVAAGALKAGCKGSFICWDPKAFKYQLEKTTVVRGLCKNFGITEVP